MENSITDLSTIQTYISLISDVFSILSTIILTVIAIIGLRTWKKQLKGKTEYDLSRRLLGAVYKTRNAIKIVRNPFASASEIASANREAGIEIDFKDKNYTIQSQGALYQRRWKKIQEAVSELDIEAFEAEVIWGKEINDLLIPLRHQVGILHSYVELYLKNLSKPSRHPDEELLEKIEQTIYDHYDLDETSNDNLFTQITSTAITDIENFLRPHIKMK